MTPPLPPSDELWLELVQLDTPVADGLWDGKRTAGPLGPSEEPRWREELAQLVETARRPAEPGELAGEAGVVAVMQATRARLLAASQSDAEGEAEAGETVAAGAAGMATRSLRAVPGGLGADARSDGRRARSRRGKVRLVGRMVVAKGVAAAGAVGFGVAAAAATGGIVASGIVASLVLPESVEEQPVDESPEAPTGAGAGVVGPGEVEGGDGAQVGSATSGETGHLPGGASGPGAAGTAGRSDDSAGESGTDGKGSSSASSDADATTDTSVESSTAVPPDSASSETTPSSAPLDDGRDDPETTTTTVPTTTTTTSTPPDTASTECAGASLSPTAYRCGGTREDPDGREGDPLAESSNTGEPATQPGPEPATASDL